MHELGIATRIVGVVTRVMEENGAGRAGSVTVEVGLLSGIDKASLEFCFQALAKDTRLEGARLVVEEQRPTAKCRRCGGEYQVSMDDFRCKLCGSAEFDVLSGTDISIKEVEVE